MSEEAEIIRGRFKVTPRSLNKMTEEDIEKADKTNVVPLFKEPEEEIPELKPIIPWDERKKEKDSGLNGNFLEVYRSLDVSKISKRTLSRAYEHYRNYSRASLLVLANNTKMVGDFYKHPEIAVAIYKLLVEEGIK